ncbi:MAG TPA: hypothetical protein VMT54_22100 [Candidatus Cybelea sp.]|nr:hypothetical protein [Candidatus Cybelea sp.]
MAIPNPNFGLWIGCANYGDPGGFLCFIEPHKPVIRKLLKKIDTRPKVEALQRAIDAVLSSRPEIHDKRWSTHADFGKPA